MNQRYYVEPRASKDYPWQFVDIAAGLRAGPVSIHKTKREAEQARELHKRDLRNLAAETKRRLARLRAEDDSSKRGFCPACEASVTDADYEAGFCTQCSFGLLTEREGDDG